MTYIEVQAFGDFDILYTECIMVSKDDISTDNIIKDFLDINGLKSTKGLHLNKLRDYTEDFIAYLELLGFEKLKTKQIYFCD